MASWPSVAAASLGSAKCTSAKSLPSVSLRRTFPSSSALPKRRPVKRPRRRADFECIGDPGFRPVGRDRAEHPFAVLIAFDQRDGDALVTLVRDALLDRRAKIRGQIDRNGVASGRKRKHRREGGGAEAAQEQREHAESLARSALAWRDRIFGHAIGGISGRIRVPVSRPPDPSTRHARDCRAGLR